MQFIDLSVQQERIKERIDSNIQKVLVHGNYIMGPEVAELESRLRDYVGVRHAIGCASGTNALLMALMAYGVGPGDAVITTPFTFISTAEVISLLGATPIFVDIDPITYTMSANGIRSAIQALKAGDTTIHPLPYSGRLHPCRLRIKGIIPVDLFGLPADYDSINECAREHDLFVIQDAAQSFGAMRDGRRTGAHGDIGCTSFFPAKPLGCYGDGGMCFTDNDELAEKLRSIRVHGKGKDKYDNMRIGINGRLDTLQSAILLAKFEIFPEEVCLRQEAAERYQTLLANITSIVRPTVSKSCTSVWAQYSILALNSGVRKRLQDALKNAGVPTAIYYPRPLHLQTAYRSLGYRPGDFLISESVSERIFSLPMHPYLAISDQELISSVMAQADFQ